MKTSPCKGCGKPILWAQDHEGKKIPLDPKPPVYTVYGRDLDKGVALCERSTRQIFMVSHFATCPNANDFSGSRKK